MSWDTIVLGYDDTDDARRALGRAVVLAKARNARLIVSTVARALPSGAAARGIGPFDPADPPDAHREALDHIRGVLTAEGVNAEFDLEIGDPADRLLAIAERSNADLIVVGTREPGFIDRLLHGSISQDVARHSHRDVLIVH